jgi:hypothetical protein
VVNVIGFDGEFEDFEQFFKVSIAEGKIGIKGYWGKF